MDRPTAERLTFRRRGPRSGACPAAEDLQPRRQELSHYGTTPGVLTTMTLDHTTMKKNLPSAAFLFLRAPDPSHGGGENERPVYRRR